MFSRQTILVPLICTYKVLLINLFTGRIVKLKEEKGVIEKQIVQERENYEKELENVNVKLRQQSKIYRLNIFKHDRWNNWVTSK